MAELGDLHALASEFLDTCVAALETTTAGAPARRFVSPGEPVWDCCEQLAVHVQNITQGETTPGGLGAGLRADREAWLNHVLLIATITRCIPTGVETSGGTYRPPPTDELEAAAETINDDGWALWNYLHDAKSSGDLSTLCSEMFFEGILAVAPLGGCAGWTVSIRAALDGYTP